jgi:lipid A 3-O-deacylase
MITRSCKLTLLLLALSSPLAFAQDGERPNGTLSINRENDIFSGNDGHYTHGMRLAWVPDQRQPVPQWARSVAELMPWFPHDGNIRYGYAIGQSIFTPRDIDVSDPPRGERPYAGWLYGSIGLGIETGRVVDQFGLTVGMVGPASGAEKTQKWVHKVVGSDRPRGWDTQLKNELGVVATWQRSWRSIAKTRMLGNELDLGAHVGGALGNVFTYANGGVMVRFGPDLPNDYGPSRIQPGLPGSADFAPARDFRWYAFAGVEGRAVARNIFLDGNTFRDSRSVDRRKLVGDVQFGIVMDWTDVRLSYTHVLRSKEFNGQDKADSFGSLTLSFKM